MTTSPVSCESNVAAFGPAVAHARTVEAMTTAEPRRSNRRLWDGCGEFIETSQCSRVQDDQRGVSLRLFVRRHERRVADVAAQRGKVGIVAGAFAAIPVAKRLFQRREGLIGPTRAEAHDRLIEADVRV